MEVALLSDGRGGLPRDVLFEDVPPGGLGEPWEGEYPADLPYNCLLVRAPGATILVDAGLGDAEHPLGGSGGRLPSELARHGVEPGDVDVVVVTHGHPDHVGGLVRDGQPAFPAARHVVHEAEWELWTSEYALAGMSEVAATVARERLHPLEPAGLLETVAGETEVAPGVRLLLAPGHTPGHLAVEVEGRLLFAVDALLHPAQVERPEVGRGLDRDPEQAVETRQALLARAADNTLPLAATHLEAPLRVERAGARFHPAAA